MEKTTCHRRSKSQTHRHIAERLLRHTQRQRRIVLGVVLLQQWHTTIDTVEINAGIIKKAAVGYCALQAGDVAARAPRSRQGQVIELCILRRNQWRAQRTGHCRLAVAEPRLEEETEHDRPAMQGLREPGVIVDRKSTRLNTSHKCAPR